MKNSLFFTLGLILVVAFYFVMGTALAQRQPFPIDKPPRVAGQKEMSPDPSGVEQQKGRMDARPIRPVHPIAPQEETDPPQEQNVTTDVVDMGPLRLMKVTINMVPNDFIVALKKSGTYNMISAAYFKSNLPASSYTQNLSHPVAVGNKLPSCNINVSMDHNRVFMLLTKGVSPPKALTQEEAIACINELFEQRLNTPQRRTIYILQSVD